LKEYHVFITVTANTVSILMMTRVYVGFRAILSLTPQAGRRVRISDAAFRLNTAPGTVTDKEVFTVMCKYYNQCGFCANFDKAADPDHGCKVFGPAIGDGQPFCGSFLCIVSDCHRFECIS